jgi:hypothetical protein
MDGVVESDRKRKAWLEFLLISKEHLYVCEKIEKDKVIKEKLKTKPSA